MISERVATIAVIMKQVSEEAISSEEKWATYVDNFVQSSSSDSQTYPFLKRNLSNSRIGDVVTVSGLELKICVNTYKIFFVDGTEDYFWRRDASGVYANERRLDIMNRFVVDSLEDGY